MSEFLHMGGYGFYVWSAYGLAAVVLTLNFVKPLYSGRKQRERLARKLRQARRTAA